MSELGERVAAIAATLEAFQEYEHQRWHGLNNDLQLLVNLPRDMARDLAKLEARLDAKFGDRLSAIEARLTAIEARGNQLSGARMFGVWIVQTVIAAIIAVAAVVGVKHP